MLKEALTCRGRRSLGLQMNTTRYVTPVLSRTRCAQQAWSDTHRRSGVGGWEGSGANGEVWGSYNLDCVKRKAKSSKPADGKSGVKQLFKC